MGEHSTTLIDDEGQDESRKKGDEVFEVTDMEDEKEDVATPRQDEECDNCKTLEEEVKRCMTKVERLQSHLLQLEDQHTEQFLEAEEAREEALKKCEEWINKHKEAESKCFQLERDLQQTRLEIEQRRESGDEKERRVAELSSAIATLEEVMADMKRRYMAGVREGESRYQKVNEERKRLQVEVVELRALQEVHRLCGAKEAQLKMAMEHAEEKCETVRQENTMLKAKFREECARSQRLLEGEKGKVDRELMATVFIQYVRQPERRMEVIRVIAELLALTNEQRGVVGLSDLPGSISAHRESMASGSSQESQGEGDKPTLETKGNGAGPSFDAFDKQITPAKGENVVKGGVVQKARKGRGWFSWLSGSAPPVHAPSAAAAGQANAVKPTQSLTNLWVAYLSQQIESGDSNVSKDGNADARGKDQKEREGEEKNVGATEAASM